MENLAEFEYPTLPESLRNELFDENNQFVVVGVLGKSLAPHCNKMDAFEVLEIPASLSNTSDPKKCRNGRIIFYVDRKEKLIYLHFETSFDLHIMQDLLRILSVDQDYFQVNATLKSKFAQVFLFAASVCHILVLVDPLSSFDTSYLAMFQALSTVREKCFMKYVKKSLAGEVLFHLLGKELRLCAPKMIFLFDKPPGMDNAKVEQHELDLEHEIYSAFKAENLLSKNTCLFVLHKKFPFVHVQRETDSTLDPVNESIGHLMDVLSNYSHGVRTEEPWVGFGRSFGYYSSEHVDGEIEKAKEKHQQEKYSLRRVIRRHVKDIIASNQPQTPDESGKQRTTHRINLPDGRTWLEIFELLHGILLAPAEQEDAVIDPEYKIFIEKFNRLIDTDGAFFQQCCEDGHKKALKLYELNLRSHYSRVYHEQKLQQSYVLYLEYARGSKVAEFMGKLKADCDQIWMSNRQLCESLSLRGNPCIMSKATQQLLDHSHTSGVVFVSTCNCGRTQARREDPYNVKHANYEFYELVSCAHCAKCAERILFPVFQPSINDFCAANVSLSPDNLTCGFGGLQLEGGDQGGDEMDEDGHRMDSNNTTPLTQQSHSDLLSYEEFLNRATPEERKRKTPKQQHKDSRPDGLTLDKEVAAGGGCGEEELNEIVVKVGELRMDPKAAKDSAGGPHYPEGMLRQPSTTEYLPGMVTTTSPVGLLPLFPSWSLMCIGKSLIYSHSTGIQDHFQGKFLSGANFLIPWNVHVRLEHASNWTANYERARKKAVSAKVFKIKIFIGMEYECPKGHRFVMAGPNKIIQSADLTDQKNLGSRVAFDDMPLYYPCRCQRDASPLVAQLMRVHVVTPKAPVNIILEPKVRIGNRTTNPLIFTTGLAEPAKLSQSNYWMLRLPYVYQLDETPILPPMAVDPNNALIYGCLLAGMFGIVESEEPFE